jgi:hypothetical protein
MALAQTDVSAPARHYRADSPIQRKLDREEAARLGAQTRREKYLPRYCEGCPDDEVVEPWERTLLGEDAYTISRIPASKRRKSTKKHKTGFWY